MGYINNDNRKFVVVNITLEDLFKTDKNAIRFVLASLAVWFMRRKAPHLAEQINGSVQTLTDWTFNDGQFTVCVGKKGYEREAVKSDIHQYIESLPA